MLTTENRMCASARRTNRFRKQTLSGAGIALAAIGGSASAAVIHDETTYTSPIIPDNKQYSSDFSFTDPQVQLQSEVDVSALAYSSGMNESLWLQAPPGSSVVFGVLNTGYLSLLPKGATVDGSLTFGAANSPAYLENSGTLGGTGAWNYGDTGYAGFDFDLNGTTVYGWMQVTLTEGKPAGAHDVFSVTRWAYDDTGAPVYAGHTPEPGTVMLLVAGALVGLRRRLSRRR